MNLEELSGIDISSELPEFMTPKMVAELLQVNVVTIHRYIKRTDNPLPVVYINHRTPRILRSQFNEWIDKMTEGR